MHDKKLCNAVRVQLEQDKVAVYMAEDNTRPGSSLSDKVIDAIKACNIFVVPLTKNGLESALVHSEIGAAKTAGKLIIPMLQADLPRPTILQGIECAEFDENDPEKGLDSVSQLTT